MVEGEKRNRGNLQRGGGWLLQPAARVCGAKAPRRVAVLGCRQAAGVLEPQQEGGIEVRPPLWLLGATLPTSLRSAGGVEVARCEQPCPAGEVRR